MSRSRARKRAIRERMAETGESYTRAARLHDEQRATQQPAEPEPAPGHTDTPPNRPANALALPFVAPPD